MTSLLLFHPLKVCFNPFQDLRGFALAETFSEPLNRVFITLTVIASIYTMTGWQNIICGIASALRLGNEVILRQYMPQSSGAVTISTTIIPVVQASLPILLRECSNQFTLARSTIRLSTTSIITMSLRPIADSGSLYISASLFIFFSIFSIFLLSFRITSIPLLALLAFFRIFLLELTPNLSRAIWIIFRPLSACLFMAGFAFSVETSSGFIEVFGSCREFFAALGAELKGIRDIQHSNLLSLPLGFRSGPAPRKAVVRRVIKPSQALFIIPQKATA